jgi:hypothetical protein
MRILYMPRPMLLSDLDLWVKPEAKKCVATEAKNEYI